MKFLANALLGALALGACSAPREDVSPSTGGGRREPPPAADVAVLPTVPSQFAPSQARVEGGRSRRGVDLADVSTCQTCHADVVAEWQSSAHAFASFNNPIYRSSVDRFRNEVGRTASRFCAGCHDVSLLVDGAMDGEIAPGDPRAAGGVTCQVCHGIVATRPDGNGSYVLAADPIPIPDMTDPASIARHKRRAAPPPLRTPELCGSCHRSFLDESTGNPTFLAGMDEIGTWSRSGYAGSMAARIDDVPERKACKDCHMPPENAPLGDVAARSGRISSHRFVGGHTWLASMRGDRLALEREQENLRSAASVDIAAVVAADGSKTLPAEGAPVQAGQRVIFDVVVRNQEVGHRFPGGTLDAQDTWVELVVKDADGRVLAEAGADEAESGDDPTAHVFRALVAGEDGTPLLARETHLFRAVVANHTIAPRDAALLEYAFDVPERLSHDAQPLLVLATLRHRTHDLALQRQVCDEASTPRGRAFHWSSSEAAKIDPCEPQPVTNLAEAEVWIGDGASARAGTSPRPTWRRLYEHGLAEEHNLQERLEEGRASLERAWRDVDRVGTDRERAMVLGALAWLPAHEGRTEEALDAIARTERLAPDDPALASLRATALESVWRWSDALAPLSEAALAAPRDDAIAARLAVALGSVDDAPDALAAAESGLRLSPRDPDLLRVRAIALRELDPEDPSLFDAAEEVYLAHRPTDDAPRIRSECAAHVPGCALERTDVHVHVMRPR